MKSTPLVILIFIIHASLANAQDQLNHSAVLNLFLDCRTNCDIAYFKEHLDIVNYVRDQEQADVHLIINAFTAGNGGRIYELDFVGLRQFDEMKNQLVFDASPTLTDDEIRKGITEKIKLGLVAYWVHTPMGENISLQMRNVETRKDPAEEIVDPWNFWVIEMSARGNMNKESQRTTIRSRLGLEVNRVTEDWRILQNSFYNNTYNKFEQEEGDDIISQVQSAGLFGKVVKSMGEHWSAGVMNYIFSSTFRNLKYSARIGPAVEYSIYPYSEVISHELTIAYHLGFRKQSYLERTIFGKMDENLMDESIQIALRLRRPWGNLFSTLEGSHYFHDFSKNRLEFSNRFSIRVMQGLNVDFSTNINLINDQLSLAEGDASLADVLLQQKQLSTNYDLSASLGVSYTFGSIYNNVVNTRL